RIVQRATRPPLVAARGSRSRSGPARPRAARGGRGGREADRVASWKRDYFEAIAVVEISRHDRADGIETHARARQHHQSRTHPRPIDDADAHAAVDRGGILSG